MAKILKNKVAAMVATIMLLAGSFGLMSMDRSDSNKTAKKEKENACPLVLKKALETKGKQATYYFSWDASNNRWQQVDSEDDLPQDCNSGPTNCAAVSDQITSTGQPTGNVEVQTRQ